MDGNPTPRTDQEESQPRLADAGPTEPADEPLEYVSVIRATRTWIQYGIFGFAVLCIVIGAVEAMFGR
jgi:hypothetical protein